MDSFKTYYGQNMMNPMKVSLTKPLRHDRRNKERGLNRKHHNIIPNQYKLQPGEIQAIKSIQQGSHYRVPVNKSDVAMICSKYNIILKPDEEKCINSNSRIYIKIKSNGEGEVYKK